MDRKCDASVEAPLHDYPEVLGQQQWALTAAKDCAGVLMSQKCYVALEVD
jgi:hypothetical protein